VIDFGGTLMIKLALSLFMISLGSLFSLQSLSYAGSMTAELEANQISLGDSTNMVLTISGSLNSEIEIPEIAGLDIYQNGTSTNIQMSNGSITKETVYQYLITPQKTGSFQIPPIKAKIDKETVATLPQTLKVEPSGSSVPSSNATQTSPSPEGNSTDAPIYIERELLKGKVYEGQAIPSKVRIFQKLGVRMRSLVPEREASPDWRIVSKEEQRTYQDERNGQAWHVTELTEVLVPLKAGRLELPKFTLRASYIETSKRNSRRGGSVWDMFGSGIFETGKEVSKKVSSETQSVDVKSLPANKPDNFADIVGEFQLLADVSRRNLKEKETSTISLTLKGVGALDRMIDPILSEVSGVRIYADKPQISEQVSEGGLMSEKVWKFAVVPSEGGAKDFGDVKFSVFNPAKESWDVLKVSIGVLTVEQGVIASGGAAANSQPQDAKEVATLSSPKSEKMGLALEEPKVLPEVSDRFSVGLGFKNWLLGVSFLGAILVLLIAARPLRQQYFEKSKKSKDVFSSLRKSVRAVSEKDLESNPELILKIIYSLKESLCLAGELPESFTGDNIYKRLLELQVDDNKASLIRSALLNVEEKRYRDLPIADHDAVEIRRILLELKVKRSIT
jgi:hypothetical protein